jgi:hypothetical protein
MAKEDMKKGESLKSKALYKIELYLIKTIPMILSLIALLNTILSYFYIDVPLLSYIGGTSIFTLIFLYMSSIVFRFCRYHRMFIHYVTVNWILNIIDYYIGIPVSNKGMFLIYMALTGITLFIILYLKFKKNES